MKMEALIALRVVSHWDKNDTEVVMQKSLMTRVCKNLLQMCVCLRIMRV